jgi:hypothetical protein
MHRTKSDNSGQPRRWKPLSQAQENVLLLLLQGKSDGEVAADPGVDVTRQTIWHWRHRNPMFMAALERRRGEVYRQAQERLRSLLRKAVENVATLVESGDFDASIHVLKAVGMYGNGTMNAIRGQDPAQHFDAEVERRLDAEKVLDEFDEMTTMMNANSTRGRRRAEIEAELWAEYGEAAD